MPNPCPICEDSGLRIVERPDGTRAAQECSCRREKRAARQLNSARIPDLFKDRTLENYRTDLPGADRSLSIAKMQAQSFIEGYPMETGGKGLLFVGTPGLGKTHLAIATLRGLMQRRGVQGLFVDYRDLLKQVQNSYNPTVTSTELEILRPVFEAEVLVIDDIGASKPSDWVFDTVAHILNSRYNRQLSTILTTNFANLPEKPYEELVQMTIETRTMRPRTLGDQIGDRVLSRLQEMCTIVEMAGKDFRRKGHRADMKPVPELPHSSLDRHEPRTKSKVTVAGPGKLVLRRAYHSDVPPQQQEEDVVGRKRMGTQASPSQPPE